MSIPYEGNQLGLSDKKIPTEGLVFYMPMTSINDFQSTSDNVTVSNYHNSYPVQFTTQNGIRCSYYYGSSNRSLKVSNIQSSFPFGGTSRSFSFWVKKTSNSSIRCLFFSYSIDGGRGNFMNCAQQPTNGIFVDVNFARSYDVILQGAKIDSQINDTIWHHVALVMYNNQSNYVQGQVYVDGILKYQGYSRNTMNTLVGSDCYIGGRCSFSSDWTFGFTGYLSAFRVYNRVLTASQVGQLASELHPTT